MNNPFTELLLTILNQVFWYILIIFIIIGIIAIILYKFGLLDNFLGFIKINEVKNENQFALVSEGKVFTNTELKFFNELNKLVNNSDYYLFKKIRLVDLVKLKKAEYGKYMSIFNKLSKKHIDFIIVDKYGNIKILIELDDKYHNSNKAKINDKFKNELSLYLNILLVRYKAGNDYNFDNIKNILI